MAENVVFKRSNLGIVSLHRGIRGCRGSGHVLGEGSALGHPGITTTVKQTNILVTKEGEDPERVGGPPVALIAIDHDGVIARNSFAGHQVREGLSLQVIPNNGIIEFGVPIDFDGARNVPGVIQQDVLIGFENYQSFGPLVGFKPLGGDEAFGVSVTGEFG
jgi:hypothetical protein